jgi:single-strand selective monofunctional uracil DNA glycosylase
MLKQITDDLISDLSGLTFGSPVTHVYNPLIYARAGWDAYCEKYGQGKREVLLLGLNPGPHGMGMCGVPFGSIPHVRDWMGIEVPVGKPEREHPKRPITGFECKRVEVSGRRVWTWAQERWGTPEAYFAKFFVLNWCPLLFMEESGKNRTPEKLPKAEREPLFAACDKALRRTVEAFEPKVVIGVGAVAEERLRMVVGDLDGLVIARILHPSPASPAANRGWAGQVDKALSDLAL